MAHSDIRFGHLCSNLASPENDCVTGDLISAPWAYGLPLLDAPTDSSRRPRQKLASILTLGNGNRHDPREIRLGHLYSNLASPENDGMTGKLLSAPWAYGLP